jgi:hypothetical protein
MLLLQLRGQAAQAQRSGAEAREDISKSVAWRLHDGLNSRRGVMVVCACGTLRVTINPERIYFQYDRI